MNDTPGQPNKRPAWTRTLAICAVIAAAGAALLFLVFNTQPGVERETAVRQSAVLVDVVTPQAGDFQPLIQALGTVRPARQIELRSRVSGQVIDMSERLAPGGFVSAGDILLRIEDADYRNALLQRQSELQQALAALDLEKGQQIQAEREYRDLKRDRGEDVDPANLSLILRQPQLQSAEASVDAARAAEAQARLDLERTVIRAPFDAMVLDRTIDLGSQVSSGEALAQLVGLDRYWVEATVPLDKLRWLDFAHGDPASGSSVALHHRSAWPEQQTRTGYLDQLVGELEGGTRLARVLVVVDDPLARQPGHDGEPGLIIGAYMDTRISGRQISGALKLPRALVRQGNTVWLVRDGALAIQPVSIEFEDANYAYIGDGLAATDQVVSTNLATVKEGLRLRPREPDAQP